MLIGPIYSISNEIENVLIKLVKFVLCLVGKVVRLSILQLFRIKIWLKNSDIKFMHYALMTTHHHCRDFVSEW